MRRTRTLAVLTALIVAVTTFLVPATARADVTDAKLSVAFDRRSADRVATLTLTAKSESGITGVEAAVENRVDGQWTPIAALPLARTDGTANDGTWTAAYQTDIEAHPGLTRFNVTVASADGAALTRSSVTNNCYLATFTDLTTSPGVIDADQEVTVGGRVLVEKTREAGPQPAEGVLVSTVSRSLEEQPRARTATDGSFSYTTAYVDSAVLRAYVGRNQPKFCQRAHYAPYPEFVRQTVELSAEIVTPQPVKVGREVIVKGKLERNGANGLVPVPFVGVDLYLSYGATTSVVEAGHTSSDGTYELKFIPEHSGVLSVQSDRTDLVWQGYAMPGRVDIVWDAPLGSVFFSESPVRYGDTLWAAATLSNDPMDPEDPSTVRNAWVALEFSPTGESWSEIRRGRTNDRGYVKIETTATTQDGYWRLRYPGADGETLALSDVRYFEVMYGTRLDGFSAKAGPAGAVTVQGELLRLKGAEEPARGLPVYVYFMPDGKSAWEYRGKTYAGADGTFKMQFTTHLDGYWTAAFWGDDDHTQSNAPIGYVDVSVEYSTEFAELGVSPATVGSGEAITVKGRLDRSGAGGAAEAAPNKAVYVYFLPTGATEWEQKAVVQTNTAGRFEKVFTAEQDGYWTVWFFGDEGHLSVNSGSKYVDVQ